MSSSSSSPATPYPLYPSDVNVKEFVQVKLCETNYFTWRSMMLSLIQSYGLVRFATGIITAEEIVDEEKRKDWNSTDELLRGWIRATINEDYLAIVEHLETTKQAFDTLEQCSIQPFRTGPNTAQNRAARDNNASKYLPLMKAALNGDWEKARDFFEKEPDAVRAIIGGASVREIMGGASETALMVAVRSVQRNHFVRKLVDIMTPVDLAMVDFNGLTSLHLAARSGNVEAAKLLVNKNPRLPDIGDVSSKVPLHMAAECGKREMVLYLYSITKENSITEPFRNERGSEFVHALITSGFYDITLMVVRRYPEIMYDKDFGPLRTIAGEPSAFPSGIQFNLWQRLIYSCVPMKMENLNNEYSRSTNCGDIENADGSFFSVNVKRKLNGLLWKFIEIPVPQIKQIRDKKLIHHQALLLVKHLCTEIVRLENFIAVLQVPLHMAAAAGIHEIVKEVLDSFPSAVYLQDEDHKTIFHLAIENRREMVFNIIYQFEGLSSMFLSVRDDSENVGLHLAGYYGPEQSQGLTTSAAGPVLQMQREIQWFQEVEKLSLTIDKQKRNFDKLSRRRTPKEIFDQEHKELMKEGELWLKGTSGSCTIIGALIVTVMFAAAITVPGGTKSKTGLPFFSTRKAFVIFAISDVLALFLSASSLLLFLSILTSYYSERDFLSSLPKRLITGYVTLFYSILFMMIAFGATIQISLGEENSWVRISLIGLVSTPVMLFVFLQFPLLFDVMESTYDSGNFSRRSSRSFY